MRLARNLGEDPQELGGDRIGSEKAKYAEDKLAEALGAAFAPGGHWVPPGLDRLPHAERSMRQTLRTAGFGEEDVEAGLDRLRQRFQGKDDLGPPLQAERLPSRGDVASSDVSNRSGSAPVVATRPRRTCSAPRLRCAPNRSLRAKSAARRCGSNGS